MALSAEQLTKINRVRDYMTEHGEMDARTAYSFALSLVVHADGLLPILSEGEKHEQN